MPSNSEYDPLGASEGCARRATLPFARLATWLIVSAATILAAVTMLKSVEKPSRNIDLNGFESLNINIGTLLKKPHVTYECETTMCGQQASGHIKSLDSTDGKQLNFINSDEPAEDCAKIIKYGFPQATGFLLTHAGGKGLRESTATCVIFYDGWCDVFNEDGPGWNSVERLGGTMRAQGLGFGWGTPAAALLNIDLDDSTHVCTFPVSATTGAWRKHKCVLHEQPEGYKLSLGTEKSSSWTQSAKFSASVKETVGAEYSVEEATGVKKTMSTESSMAIKPTAEQGKLCIWQWVLYVSHAKDDIEAMTQYTALTLSETLTPKCLPDKFQDGSYSQKCVIGGCLPGAKCVT